jgi:hypothetical protein
MLITLTYASHTLIPAYSPEMLAIARTSLRNNARLGVTGALYFDGMQFFQVLEGEEGTVACLFDAIRADARHCDVKTVARRPILQRRFAGWPMKFIDGTDRRDLRPVFDYRASIGADNAAQQVRIDALLAA